MRGGGEEEGERSREGRGGGGRKERGTQSGDGRG